MQCRYAVLQCLDEVLQCLNAVPQCSVAVLQCRHALLQCRVQLFPFPAYILVFYSVGKARVSGNCQEEAYILFTSKEELSWKQHPLRSQMASYSEKLI
jgi:hypothetical protein